MVERFNHTSKTISQKHGTTYGNQWEQYLFGALYSYRNTPMSQWEENLHIASLGLIAKLSWKLHFYHFPNSTNVTDYREEFTQALSTARNTAVASIQQAQCHYKKQYGKDTKPLHLQTGDWVLICFPADESRMHRKLSQPWHGPFHDTAIKGPDGETSNIYFPQDDVIMVHQSRVEVCPQKFTRGFY